ncbi:MAG: hypothetical protein KDA60_15905 [Planctomycetales bacterium]|nr:hypothetical protein [Planctomycetales bacterium]
MSDTTRLLNRIEQGDKMAASELLPLAYDELRKLAAAKMCHERPGQTLDATAVVHGAGLPKFLAVGRVPLSFPRSPAPYFPDGWRSIVATRHA